MPFSFEELNQWIEHLESLDGHLREAELQRLDQSNPGLAQHVRAVLRGAAWSDASPADGDVLHGVNRLDSPPNTCRVVGKFELVEKIGEGGMGEVYLAVNQDLREIRQAVKLIKPGLGSGAALREATTAAALATDPRIVAVRDVCELTDGSTAIIMDYVEGVPIDAWMRKPGNDMRRIVDRFLEAVDAVAEIHRRNYVHGDLKPAHILVTMNDEVRILDFGVSVSLDNPAKACIGYTKYWASPQRLDGRVPTPADDVYPLGRIFQEIFSVSEASSASLSIILSPLMCADINRVIDKCVANDVAVSEQEKGSHVRYLNAGELAADLRAILENRPLQAVQPWPGYRCVCLMRRHWLIVGALLLVVAAGMLTTRLWAARQQVQQMAENRLRDQKTFEELAARESKLIRRSILEEVRESIGSLPEGDNRNDLLLIITKLEDATLTFEIGDTELAISRLRELLRAIDEFPVHVRSLRGWRVTRFAAALYLADQLLETTGVTADADEAVKIAIDALGSAPDPELLPFRADALDRLGRIAVGRSDFKQADHFYEQAEVLRLQLPPETPRRCLNLAISRLHRADIRTKPEGGLLDLEVARGWLSEARDLIGREVTEGRSIEIARAVIFERLGELTLNHDGPEDLELASGYLTSAEQTYRQLLTLDPDSPEFNLRLAIVLQFCGDVSREQGIREHSRVATNAENVKKYFEDADARYQEAINLLNRPQWPTGKHVTRLECLGCILRRRVPVLPLTGAPDEAVVRTALQAVSLYRMLYESTRSLPHVADLADSIWLASFVLGDAASEETACLLNEGVFILKEHGASHTGRGRLDERLRELEEALGKQNSELNLL